MQGEGVKAELSSLLSDSRRAYWVAEGNEQQRATDGEREGEGSPQRPGREHLLPGTGQGGYVSEPATSLLAARQHEELLEARVFLQIEERHLIRGINVSFHGGRSCDRGRHRGQEGSRKWQLWGVMIARVLGVYRTEEPRKGMGNPSAQRWAMPFSLLGFYLGCLQQGYSFSAKECSPECFTQAPTDCLFLIEIRNPCSSQILLS